MRILLLLAALPLFAQEKPIVLGHGSARYTLDLDWAKADLAVAPVVNATNIATATNPFANVVH